MPKTRPARPRLMHERRSCARPLLLLLRKARRNKPIACGKVVVWPLGYSPCTRVHIQPWIRANCML